MHESGRGVVVRGGQVDVDVAYTYDVDPQPVGHFESSHGYPVYTVGTVAEQSHGFEIVERARHASTVQVEQTVAVDVTVGQWVSTEVGGGGAQPAPSFPATTHGTILAGSSTC